MKEEDKKKLLSISYVAVIFFAIHYYSLYFILSSYLNQYFSKGNLSIIFAIGAIFSIILSQIFGNLLKKYTNKKSLGFILILQLVTTFSLIFSNHINKFIIILLFIILFSLFTLIWTSINVFIEEFSDHENIGSIRGTVLTIHNFGAIAAPFISAQFFNILGFSGLFTISAIAIIPLIYLTNTFFSHIKEPKYIHTGLKKSFLIILKNPDIKGVILSSFILNSFYAVVNIYLSLYLIEYLNIPLLIYLEIIVPVSIIPFILIPYELGKYSDEIFGEKKAMIFGIVLMSFVLICIYIFDIHTINILAWIAILLIARIGAAITETENYAYFYKKIDGRSAGLIALFQNMTNLAFVFVTILGVVLINIFNTKITLIFLIIGILGIISIITIKKIRDTEIKRGKIEAEKDRLENEIRQEEEKKENEAEKEIQNNNLQKKDLKIWA